MINYARKLTNVEEKEEDEKAEEKDEEEKDEEEDKEKRENEEETGEKEEKEEEKEEEEEEKKRRHTFHASNSGWMTTALSRPLPRTNVTRSVGNLRNSASKMAPSRGAFSVSFSSSRTSKAAMATLQPSGLPS